MKELRKRLIQIFQLTLLSFFVTAGVVSSIIFYYGVTTDENAYMRNSGVNASIPSWCINQRTSKSILSVFRKGSTAFFGPLDRAPVTFRLLNSGTIEIDQRFSSLSIMNSNLHFEAASESMTLNDVLAFSYTQDASIGYPADFIIFTESQRVSDVQGVVDAIQNYFDGKMCGRIFVQMDTSTLSDLASATKLSEVYDWEKLTTEPTNPNQVSEPIVISMTKNGSIYLNAQSIETLEELTKTLRVVLINNNDRTVFFRGDEALSIAVVNSALQAIYNSGALDIKLVAQD